MENQQNASNNEEILLIIALLIGAFLSTLNMTNINIALPTLMTHFNTDMATVQWIVVGFMLTNGLIMPAIGYFTDRFGGRNLFAFGLLILAVSSALCAMAPNIEVLIAARLLQGISGGIIMPVPFTLVYQFVSRERQLMTTSIVSVAIALGTALGPTVAGLFIDNFGWPSLFLFNIPFALLDCVLVMKFVPHRAFNVNKKLDIAGLLASMIATVAILFGFNQGSKLGWTSPITIALLAIGVTCLTYFIARELKTQDAMLNFHVFRYKGFRYTFVFNAVANIALCLTPMFMAIFLQSVTGLNALEAGLAMLIPALFMGIMSPISAKCTKYISKQMLILLGMLVFLLATWQLSLFTVTTTVLVFNIWLSVRYIGIGLMNPLLTDFSMGSVPPALSGHASAMMNWTRQLLTTITVSMFSLLYNSRLLQYTKEGIGVGLDSAAQQQLIQANAISDINFYTMIIIIVSLPMVYLLKDSILDEHK
ncbi:MAG: DHA2 family efflux MFS transporter permease subunit [Peptococcaceae bacterium]|nr:DHA2 family efflux MFS transporter permease subunit [Peptococcaceae bacterium]